jgi:serine/threonine-protein kinase
LDWRKSISGIFDTSLPTSTSWFSLDEIVNVLKTIAEPNLNHCFFPTGGGMDLVAATASHEEGCLELRWSPRWVSLLKPKELRLEVFPGFPSLSYFRLEAAPLEPWADGIDPTKQLSEEVVELAPGEYLDSSVLDEGYHDEYGNEIPLPTSTREVTRYFGGSFVFFAKGSAYNGLRGPFDGYDAQHNKMSAEDFRRFVSDLIRVAALSETELEPDRR